MLPKEEEVPELPEKTSGIRRRKREENRKTKGRPQRREVHDVITQFPPFLISLTPETPRNKIKEIVTAVLEAIDEYRKKVA